MHEPNLLEEDLAKAIFLHIWGNHCPCCSSYLGKYRIVSILYIFMYIHFYMHGDKTDTDQTNQCSVLQPPSLSNPRKMVLVQPRQNAAGMAICSEKLDMKLKFSSNSSIINLT